MKCLVIVTPLEDAVTADAVYSGVRLIKRPVKREEPNWRSHIGGSDSQSVSMLAKVVVPKKSDR